MELFYSFFIAFEVFKLQVKNIFVYFDIVQHPPQIHTQKSSVTGKLEEIKIRTKLNSR
jgi:hypothetical protein